MRPTIDPAPDEARSLEHADMLRHGGEGDRERSRDVGDTGLTACQPTDDRATNVASEGRVDIAQIRSIFNHQVE
jgi:hypothetical protein